MSFYFSDLFVDTSSLPDDGYGFFQVLFLLAIYSAFIIYGSVLLIQGSELLVFIPSMSTIVGSVIVPLLGQMSDLVIVLFSCIGPNADEEFLIGVGSLAGSTIFIITILWFFSVMHGRVDYDEPSHALAYKHNPKLTSTIFQLRTYTGSGVSIDSFTKMTAVYMILTSLTYLIILFPNILYANNDAEIIGEDEKYYGLGAFIVGIVLLLAYLFLQFSQSNSQEDNLTTDIRDELVVHTLQRRLVTLLGALSADIENRDSDSDSDGDDYLGGISRSMTLDEESAMHSFRRDGSNPNSNRSAHNRSGHLFPSQHGSFNQGNGNRARHVYYGTHDNRNPDREQGQQQGDEHGSYQNFGMAAPEGESSRPLMRSSRVKRRLRRILRPFFLVYDFNHQGMIHSNDLHSVFHDFGESLPHQALVMLFDKYTDRNGQISFRDFVEGTWEFLSHHDEILITLGRLQSSSDDDGMELSTNSLFRGHDIRDSHFNNSPVNNGENATPRANTNHVTFDSTVMNNNLGTNDNTNQQSRETNDRNNRREVNFYTGLMFNLFGTREGESILPIGETGSPRDGSNSNNNNSNGSEGVVDSGADKVGQGNSVSGGDNGGNDNNNNNNDAANNSASKVTMDDDDEMDPIPEDMVALTPEEQQEAIKWRASLYLFFGTALLVFFMPPMIDAMLELSSRIGISVFYVSFVVSPLIGDAPAYIVVYRYAQRKSRKSISITFNTLLGSVVVNNTLVLAVFMILIYTEGLEWDFLSETMAIFLVELVVGIYTVKNIHTLLDSILILMLYPASLLLVYFLKSDSYT